MAGAKPSDWPSAQAVNSPASAVPQKDGLATGVAVAIALVSIAVGLMLGFLVYRSIRQRRSLEVGDEKESTSFRKAGQNAPKDHSEALNIEMDGTGFRDAVISAHAANATAEDYEFDADSVEVDAEVPSPKVASPDVFGAPPMNGRHGSGHGMML